MKRLHIHIAVADLERSIRFYSTLLEAEPSVEKGDYAKWMLDDPAVNFAISSRPGRTPGIDHLGIQASSGDLLDGISSRLKAADEVTFDQQATTCCYAVSDKSWVEDPDGVRWETFYTHGDAITYGADASEGRFAPKPAEPEAPSSQGRCC